MTLIIESSYVHAAISTKKLLEHYQAYIRYPFSAPPNTNQMYLKNMEGCSCMNRDDYHDDHEVYGM